MFHEVLAYNLAKKKKNLFKSFCHKKVSKFQQKVHDLDRSGYSFFSGRIQDPDENEMQALINDIN